MPPTLEELIESQLLDNAFDCYVDWRDEAARVHAAYRRWDRCAERDRAGAYAAYLAAVDSEERAAQLYGAMVRSYRFATRDRTR